MLNSKLNDRRLLNKRIIFYSGTHGHRRTNAAFLISAWALLYLNRSPEEAFTPFKGYRPPFLPFHDATPMICTYNLSILDCLRGIAKVNILPGLFCCVFTLLVDT